MCGNVKEFSDAEGSLGKRCLFCFNRPLALESDCLEMGCSGGQITLSSEVSGALFAVLEKLKDSFTHTPGRTHNRIRSPRLAASGR